MTAPPVVSINEELIAELEAAAAAATPQDFDSAERKDEGGFCECPACGGEGSVEVESDYLNYDATAIGVQFYGVGLEHGAAERYYRCANPATILALLAERTAMQEQIRSYAITVENAEMWRRDAERYQWLREQCSVNGCLTIAKCDGWGLTGWSGDDPDRYIDAAMQEPKP